jgi:hypothetical protein
VKQRPSQKLHNELMLVLAAHTEPELVVLQNARMSPTGRIFVDRAWQARRELRAKRRGRG